MSFFKAAARLAGVAGWLLGWRPEEFWRSTPAELESVLRAARGDDAAEVGMDRGELERLRGVMPDGVSSGARPHPNPSNESRASFEPEGEGL
ncbi:Protein of unknown function DUF2376, phage [Sphingobium chlorophenolicum L-1]|uniref:Phage tail assembly chaperone n=1 Tax=Sphingobium chlorophenolicum L-1 TaxID=690566 RepID=F6EUY6_SPHCR|nr:Protein of unknown function DUF2376, phage [Sphingobium chlorophenolicum L-1]